MTETSHDRTTASPRAGLFGPLPTRGIWTALDLGRTQFLGILALSLLVFVLVDGPLWAHLRESHFTRLVVSYTVIPPAALWALRRNGKLHLRSVLVASLVLSAIKFVLTAAMLILIGLARS